MQQPPPASSPSENLWADWSSSTTTQGHALELARRHPLLQSLWDSALQSLVARSRLRALAADEIVLEAGKPNDALYLVLSGRLFAVLSAERADGRMPIEAGECFGEMSVIEGKPVSATVVAGVGTCVLQIPEDAFWEAVIANPLAVRDLLRSMSERMRQRSELVTRSLHERLEFEAVQRELRLAREMQLSMLPDGQSLLSEHANLEAAAMMTPAKEVGGDFYDAFSVDRGRVFLALGDVAGKGVAAALFMARSLTTLRQEVTGDRAADSLMTRFNDAMCEHNAQSIFVTMFASFVDARSGELAYFNAGHDAGLVISPGGAIRALNRPQGPIAGVVAGVEFGMARDRLAPGDILFAYTDGVTEAHDGAKHLFGQERLLTTLRAARPTRAADALQAVNAAVAEFVGDAAQSDDITIVAVRYAGPPSRPA